VQPRWRPHFLPPAGADACDDSKYPDLKGQWRRTRLDAIQEVQKIFLSADVLLMPAKKNQPPPDLRDFTERQK
jgi:hypothetical protein